MDEHADFSECSQRVCKPGYRSGKHKRLELGNVRNPPPAPRYPARDSGRDRGRARFAGGEPEAGGAFQEEDSDQAERNLGWWIVNCGFMRTSVFQSSISNQQSKMKLAEIWEEV